MDREAKIQSHRKEYLRAINYITAKYNSKIDSEFPELVERVAKEYERAVEAGLQKVFERAYYGDGILPSEIEPRLGKEIDKLWLSSEASEIEG